MGGSREINTSLFNESELGSSAILFITLAISFLAISAVIIIKIYRKKKKRIIEHQEIIAKNKNEQGYSETGNQDNEYTENKMKDRKISGEKTYGNDKHYGVYKMDNMESVLCDSNAILPVSQHEVTINCMQKDKPRDSLEYKFETPNESSDEYIDYNSEIIKLENANNAYNNRAVSALEEPRSTFIKMFDFRVSKSKNAATSTISVPPLARTNMF
ncbi:hypothetical protein BB561_003551 [Smittium simulii]|uniref:Uncharacterized protein n=1 Tax=Smittium simulii TaxID=133385 RepID=A0A2T9YKM0_9FUNG|nr:hypothetical protein BB561_003551 [Smittium simulii]